MRKPSEIVVASRMQHMVQIRARMLVSRQNYIIDFVCNNSFGALGVEGPHGGAIHERPKLEKWYLKRHPQIGAGNG